MPARRGWRGPWPPRRQQYRGWCRPQRYYDLAPWLATSGARCAPTEPSVAVNYRREGLYGLRKLGLDSAYRAVVWQLARRVVDIVGSYRVEPLTVGGPEELHNAFAEVRR